MNNIHLKALAALFISVFTLSAAWAGNFKNYAVGLDTTYTLGALFYGGVGGGVEGEACIFGNWSVALNCGYMNMNPGGTNNQMFYAYAGFRYYLTFDALGGPFAGVGGGIRDVAYNYEAPYVQGLIPIEIGWKFIELNTGIFIEPVFKLVLIPAYSPYVGLFADYAYFIGFNAGISF